MVPLKRKWIPFKDQQEALAYYRKWGLLGKSATELCSVMIPNGHSGPPKPCRILGREADLEDWAVIESDGVITSMHSDFLVDLQPNARQPLPRGTVFADILSHYAIADFRFAADTVTIATYRYGTAESVFGFPVSSPDIRGEIQGAIGDLPVFQYAPSCIFSLGYINDHFIPGAILDVSRMIQQVYPGLSGRSLPYLCSALGLEPCDRDVDTINSLLWACLTFRKHEEAWRATCVNERIACLPQLSAECSVTPDRPAYIESELDAGSSAPPSEYVVLDIETTGFKRDEERIIEIAAIKFRNGEKVDEFCTLINPLRTLRTRIVNLTGITQLEVDAAPTIDRIKPDFLAFIGDLPLVGHNIKTFDAPFLRAQLDCEIRADRLIDTLELAKKVYPGKPQYKLEFLSKELDLGGSVSHRAMADLEATAQLYRLCVGQNVADSAAPSPSEAEVFGYLLPALRAVLQGNNAPENALVIRGGTGCSSVFCRKFDPTQSGNVLSEALVFRICYRGNDRYFGVSDVYAHLCPDDLVALITGSSHSDGFTNYAFVPDPDCMEQFTPFLSSVLDAVIDALPKEFDCCSRFEACSNAKHCIHPNPAMALGCGYRKILKSGRIYYGTNRNID